MNKNKDLKKKYRKEFLESIGEKDFDIGIDLGKRINHFLSRCYYHDHHGKIRLIMNLEKKKLGIKENLFNYE